MYRSLLRRADGIEIGHVAVLGTEDAYLLDIPGPPRLVIVPPDEDGAFALAETGEMVQVGIDDATSNGRVVAPDLRASLLDRLGSMAGSAPPRISGAASGFSGRTRPGADLVARLPRGLAGLVMSPATSFSTIVP